MRERVKLRIASMVLVLGCGLWACGPAARPGPARPNLLLVTIDTLRADRVGAYGNSNGLTPNIDRLAAEGTVFESCAAPMATTFPSHASIFTGVYPQVHGVRYNGDTLSEELPVLAELLRAAGYRTGAFVSFRTMVARGGLGRGFEVVSDPDPGRIGVSGGAVRDGAEANALATEWLAGVAEPFFAWVHYYEPHPPYRPTPYSNQGLAAFGGRYSEGLSVREFSQARWLESDEEAEAVRTLYDGEVAASDALFGELLGSLRAQGRLDRTLVVLTGDHGEALGEHGEPGHGTLLWEAVLRVPLVVWRPWDRTARRVTERVGLVDLMPTLAELLGVEPPAPVQGRSLVPALGGDRAPETCHFAEVRALPHDVEVAAMVRRFQVGEEEAARRLELRRTGPDLAVVCGRFKWIDGPQGGELYDLESDPRELSPLPESRHPEVVARLRGLIEEFRRAPFGAGEAAGDLDPEVAKELEALGYL